MEKSQADAIARAILEPDLRAQEELRGKRAIESAQLARKRRVAWLALVSASAICVVPSLHESIAGAQTVFIATITDSTLLTPLKQLKNGDRYTVKYGFVVVKRIKGDPSIVSSLTTGATFISPASEHLDGPAEQDKFVPGDSVLVVASAPGDTPLSTIYCTPSRPWDNATYRLTRSIPGFAP